MKIKDLWRLAAKYVISYRRRYLFLFCALSLGFCVISVVISLKNGMAEAIYYSARNHYSGDIIIAGFEKEAKSDNHIYAETIPLINEKIEEAGIKPYKSIMRTMQNQDSFIHYNGSAAPIKYLVGIDWDAERDYFESMDFVEGEASSDFDDNTIIISAPVALWLGAHPGDIVLLETETNYGQKNTAFFTIGGVIDDSSMFGYFKVFAPRKTINRIINFAPDDCSTIGLFFNNTKDIESNREKLQNLLSGVIPLRPLVYDREGFEREQDWKWSGVMFFLLTVSVYVSEVTQILQALNILSYFLYVMMLLIIMISAGVTYRLILHERIKEIGVMRAIGFYENDIRRILVFESFILATVSLAAGFCLALLINWIVSYLTFSWIPGFGIFLKNGRLLALYAPAATAINIASIYAILFIAVYAPAFRSSRCPLPEMLSGGFKE